MTNIWYHTSSSTLIYPGVCDLAFKEATKIHVNHFANDLIFEELLKSQTNLDSVMSNETKIFDKIV